MKCPVCNSVELRPHERQGVEIDACPTCRGVWLDRGELDKIIERSSSVSDERRDDDRDRDRYRGPSGSPGHHGGPSEHHGYPSHKHYKKKSFWSEVFDF